MAIRLSLSNLVLQYSGMGDIFLPIWPFPPSPLDLVWRVDGDRETGTGRREQGDGGRETGTGDRDREENVSIVRWSPL